MKEQAGIIPNALEPEKVVMVGQNEKHFQEIKWHIKQHKGHTLFEINMETGDVKPAQSKIVFIFQHSTFKTLLKSLLNGQNKAD